MARYLSSALCTGVLVSLIALHDSSELAADQDSLRQSLASVRTLVPEQGILLKGKLRVSSSTHALAVPVLDFATSGSGLSQPDLLLEYSIQDKTFHRRVRLSDGASVTSLHSAVGFQLPQVKPITSKRGTHVGYQVLKGGRKFFTQKSLHTELFKPQFRGLCEEKIVRKEEADDSQSAESIPKLARFDDIEKVVFMADLLLNQVGWFEAYPEITIDGVKFKALKGRVTSESDMSVIVGVQPSRDAAATLADIRMVQTCLDGSTYQLVLSNGGPELVPREEMRASGRMQAHSGVMCQRIQGQPVDRPIRWPHTLSLIAQHLNLTSNKVDITREYYELDKRLARVDVHGSQPLDPAQPSTDHARLVYDLNLDVVFLFNEVIQVCFTLPVFKMGQFSHLMMSSAAGKTLTRMSHPLQLLMDRDSLGYKGACEDETGRGHLFIARHPVGTADSHFQVSEVCFSDADPGHPFQNFSVPLYVATYDSRVPDEGEDASLRLLSLTQFHDVISRPPLDQMFDLGSCVNPRHKTFIVLRMLWHSDSPQPLDDWTALDAHLIQARVAELLHVTSVRISRLQVVRAPPTLKGEERYVLIGFNLLEFVKGHVGHSQGGRSELERPIELVVEQLGEMASSPLPVQFQLTRSVSPSADSGGGSAAVVNERYTLVDAFELTSEEEFHLLTAPPPPGGVPVWLVLLACSSSAFAGAALGVAAAYRIWRTAPTFGYMMHTDPL